MNKYILFIIFILITSSQALAIGLSPARTYYEANQDNHISGTVMIINSDHSNSKLSIYAQGELKDTITFSQQAIIIDETDSSKEFSYTIDASKITTPGEHVGEIVFLTLPEDIKAKSDNTAILATTAVVHTVVVTVPYPGKYAQAKLYTSSANIGEPVIFTIPVYNFGKDKIFSISGTVDIYSPTNEKISSVDTQTASLESQQEIKLTTSFLANVNPGKYYVVANINYDGTIIKLEDIINIGNLNINIKDMTVSDFRLGQIAKLNIELESLWNEQLNNVYAKVTVYDKSSNIVSQFTTASINIEPYTKKTLNGFWDTQGLSEGTYDIEVELNYGSKTSKKRFETIATLNTLQILNPLGKVTDSTPKETNDQILLVVAIILLVIINITWMVIVLKKKK